MDVGGSIKLRVKSMTPAIMIIFIIVPMPGFCFKKIQNDKTAKLIRNVEVPMVIPVILVIPSARTDHGEFPVVEISNKPSPNPKIDSPKQRKKKVENLGLKLRGLSELQDLEGMDLMVNISNMITLD